MPKARRRATACATAAPTGPCRGGADHDARGQRRQPQPPPSPPSWHARM